MSVNNRKISNRIRVIHRYLGFFLAGIMFVYALSGITLIFRKTDYFKKETKITQIVETELEEIPNIKGASNITYNPNTGELSYTQMKPPRILDAMQNMHKATTASPLFVLNIIFGTCLMFFVLSSYWMFLPQTDIFKKAIYYTIGGIVLTLIMVMI